MKDNLQPTLLYDNLIQTQIVIACKFHPVAESGYTNSVQTQNVLGCEQSSITNSVYEKWFQADCYRLWTTSNNQHENMIMEYNAISSR